MNSEEEKLITQRLKSAWFWLPCLYCVSLLACSVLKLRMVYWTLKLTTNTAHPPTPHKSMSTSTRTTTATTTPRSWAQTLQCSWLMLWLLLLLLLLLFLQLLLLLLLLVFLLVVVVVVGGGGGGGGGAAAGSCCGAGGGSSRTSQDQERPMGLPEADKYINLIQMFKIIKYIGLYWEVWHLGASLYFGLLERQWKSNITLTWPSFTLPVNHSNLSAAIVLVSTKVSASVPVGFSFVWLPRLRRPLRRPDIPGFGAFCCFRREPHGTHLCTTWRILDARTMPLRLKVGSLASKRRILRTLNCWKIKPLWNKLGWLNDTNDASRVGEVHPKPLCVVAEANPPTNSYQSRHITSLYILTRFSVKSRVSAVPSW